jgi:class 3 adenylate cyclase
MRVDRTFAFVDLCGFTRFTDTYGDEDAVDVLTRFRAVVREIGSNHGVRVAKWLGDGAMFVSTSPEPLVESILAVAQRADELGVTLPLRAGLAGGQVILFEGDDYIGGAVNLAARLCDAAAPRELLAAADLAEYVPPWAVAVPVGELVIKGFVLRIDVVRVERVAVPVPITVAGGGR